MPLIVIHTIIGVMFVVIWLLVGRIIATSR